jgi:SAM-dependent MidA family methyltransferase
MSAALYGDGGFFTTGGGAGGHFRTSAHASGLFATAMLRLVVATDEALGRPKPLDVVDIGAGGGHLLRRLAAMAPAYLARRLRLSAVEVAPRPPDLPEPIGWYDVAPPPGSVSGIILATEWLDNVPLDVAEVDDDGQLRYVLVEPASGAEQAGAELSTQDAAWARQWWSHAPWEPGVRVEIGRTRDEAWADAVAGLVQGLAVTVDYGHMWYGRPVCGTLTGYYAGRSVAAVPDGSRDITAHVAIDAACAAGEAVAGQSAMLATQQEALFALGLDGSRPPLELATTDPTAYVQALSSATEAAELMSVEGLGAHYWIIQPVGITPAALPLDLSLQ